MQYEAIVKQKDEATQYLQSQITPLKHAVEQLVAEIRLEKEEKSSLLNIIKEKDRQLKSWN